MYTKHELNYIIYIFKKLNVVIGTSLYLCEWIKEKNTVSTKFLFYQHHNYNNYTITLLF